MQWRHPLPPPLLRPPTEDLQLIKRRTLCIRKIDNRQQAQWKCWKAEKRKSRWPRWRAQLKFTTAVRLRNYALIKLFYNYSHTLTHTHTRWICLNIWIFVDLMGECKRAGSSLSSVQSLSLSLSHSLSLCLSLGHFVVCTPLVPCAHAPR